MICVRPWPILALCWGILTHDLSRSLCHRDFLFKPLTNHWRIWSLLKRTTKKKHYSILNSYIFNILNDWLSKITIKVWSLRKKKLFDRQGMKWSMKLLATHGSSSSSKRLRRSRRRARNRGPGEGEGPAACLVLVLCCMWKCLFLKTTEWFGS